MLQSRATSTRSETGSVRALWYVGAIATGVVVCLSVLAPLLVYTVTLASFGAAHVLSELRYVDRRFGRTLSGRQIALMAVLLAGAAGFRALGVFAILDPQLAITAELACVAALALSVAQGGGFRSALAIGVAMLLAVATLVAPFDTVITLSLLHNLTPLAFLWELLPSHARRRGMALAFVAFIGMPLLVASGVPRLALASLGFELPGLDPMSAGPLARHLFVYLPSPLLGSTNAIDLFSGAVVAQCAHYAAVIVVLPALLARYSRDARGLVPWPRASMFFAAVAGIAVLMFMAFGHSFAATRAVYGIAASVHAWIEVPLIVLALTRSAHERESDQH